MTYMCHICVCHIYMCVRYMCHIYIYIYIYNIPESCNFLIHAVLSPCSLSPLPQNALPIELIPGTNSPGKLELTTPSERGQTSVLLEYTNMLLS